MGRGEIGGRNDSVLLPAAEDIAAMGQNQVSPGLGWCLRGGQFSIPTLVSYPFRTKRYSLDDDPMVTMAPPGPGWRQFSISALGTTLILVLCWYFANLLIKQTNQNLGPVTDPVSGEVRGDQDQKHNINQALLARDFMTPREDLGLMANLMRGMPHRTDGVVAPLWPWVAARLTTPGQPYRESEVTGEDRKLFIKGKWANVAMALAFLWALGLVLARSFRPAATVTVLLLAGFGALIPRAVYFQPEPLYFILFFFTWVCAVKLLMKNDLWLHALFGLLGGLAYLAKTSVEPLILAWFGISALRFLYLLVRNKEEDPFADQPWSRRNHFIGLIVFAFAWLAVTAPRYAAAHERWGDPRFSYPSAWMWMDDYKTCFTWMGAHPDKASLNAIPPAERPSLTSYLRTHPATAVQDRLINGTREKLTRWLSPKIVKPKADGSFTGWRVLLDRRGIYLGATAAVMLATGLLVWSRRKSVDRPGLAVPSGAWAAALFTGGTVVGYALLYGWYDPIGRGDRFMLSLYLPLVFCLVWASESLMDLAIMRRAPRWTALVYQGSLWLINGAVVWRLVEILRNPVFDPGTL